MNWYRGEQYLHDSDTYRITNVRSADSVASTLSVRCLIFVTELENIDIRSCPRLKRKKAWLAYCY